METNEKDNYVLVLEDRTEIQNPDDAGKLSVVTGIDEQGNLKTTDARNEHQSTFLKFNNNSSMLSNFMSNFLKQFNNPKRFKLYKMFSDNVEKDVEKLKSDIEKGNKEGEKTAEKYQVNFEDYLPKQKKATALDENQIDWKMLEELGVSKEKLESMGELDNMLNWQKSNLMTIAIPMGDSTIYTEARLAFRTDEEGNIGLAIHSLRKEPQLDYPYMGHKFTPEEKKQLLETGNLGSTIEVTPKNGEPFSAYVSVDPQTNELIALRADRVSIPLEIKGVKLSDEQYKNLVEGKAVPVEGMLSKNGKTFNATLQVNAEKKGIEFIFEKTPKQERSQNSVPKKLCGVELSEKQQEMLSQGKAIHIKNMVDKEGQPFNAYVKMDKAQNRPRFYKWNPEKKKSEQQEQGGEEVQKKQKKGRKL